MINGVPLLPGYRWHWIARFVWRRRGIGELANLTATRAGLRQLSRQATPTPGADAGGVHRGDVAPLAARHLAAGTGAVPLG